MNTPPRQGTATLALLALGVVYGDIGTSPLYAAKETFNPEHGIPLNTVNIVGGLSTLFWMLMIVVSLKYVILVMRAGNRGEGGIMALLALATASVKDNPRWTAPLLAIGLFLIQRHGTGVVGLVFGPVCALWFASLAAVGVWNIAKQPAILAALNPAHAVGFITGHGFASFVVLGSVLLAITGAETLYADMGHFGKRAVRVAWFGLVAPALVLNYFGQGALLIDNPKALENPFYLSYPSWALYPMIALATAATVIASQATISGAYSMTQQAIQLGYLPRMTVQHTSAKTIGQIYVPAVNWILLAAVVAAVVGFGSSTRL